ncbi:MAG: hypothetical protein CVU90_05930 [Firmicutes bacterium HGW-Firmicutes-15]|nr:MAG: hypothetical protein CVU90_05930 [Firmicutes bacterium HGW-Firmicutes-15]
MEITSIGMNYNNTPAKSESVKQASATEQQEVNVSKTKEVIADSFIKSSVTDAISKRDESTLSNTSLDVFASSKTNPQGATDNTSSDSKLATAKLPIEKPTVSANSNTEVTAANAGVISDVSTETTKSAIATVTSTSEYTAAEIAEYDLDGNGVIDAQEEAKMKAAQVKEASKDGLSFEQMEAKEAYETAKTQLLSLEDESVINEQI